MLRDEKRAIVAEFSLGREKCHPTLLGAKVAAESYALLVDQEKIRWSYNTRSEILAERGAILPSFSDCHPIMA